MLWWSANWNQKKNKCLALDNVPPSSNNSCNSLLVKRQNCDRNIVSLNPCRNGRSELVNTLSPVKPQWITQGLKETSVCLLFTMHTNHQTANSPKNTKSVPKQITLIKTYTNIRHNFFEELLEFSSPELTLCADFYSVSVLSSPCYCSGM